MKFFGWNIVLVAMMTQLVSSEMSPYVALGAGCYWGTEKYIKKDFQSMLPGSIKATSVGFMNPDSDPKITDPTYGQVTSGKTGHVEVLWVELVDPAAHFEELVRFFFKFHDPTTADRQGNDVGTQYASRIFVSDDEQAKISTRVREELQQHLDAGKIASYSGTVVKTKISAATRFTQAHEEHQEYLFKNPSGYCNHRIRFNSWPEL
eukprot:CAMPEP_0194304492 /NCGR_PEP_ID=MMETSP0171-20130528/2243_1 /TAXON_ID=218684 /ORGANISM="Corethron pennatum, Strain L29A3" /LENGTH=205 /DNA_ID=CAMNT_0039055803 /DNA_START=89 /DNA_END=706 /DNA_ORIENTATION=-